MGAAVSVLGWVLVGLGAWLLGSVVAALVLAHLIRANCVSALDVLPARHRREPDPLTVPSEDGASDADPAEESGELPAPRSGAHDEAAAAERRGPPE